MLSGGLKLRAKVYIILVRNILETLLVVQDNRSKKEQGQIQAQTQKNSQINNNATSTEQGTNPNLVNSPPQPTPTQPVQNQVQNQQPPQQMQSFQQSTPTATPITQQQINSVKTGEPNIQQSPMPQQQPIQQPRPPLQPPMPQQQPVQQPIPPQPMPPQPPPPQQQIIRPGPMQQSPMPQQPPIFNPPPGPNYPPMQQQQQIQQQQMQMQKQRQQPMPSPNPQLNLPDPYLNPYSTPAAVPTQPVPVNEQQSTEVKPPTSDPYSFVGREKEIIEHDVNEEMIIEAPNTESATIDLQSASVVEVEKERVIEFSDDVAFTVNEENENTVKSNEHESIWKPPDADEE